jgi:hypothetical protein
MPPKHRNFVRHTNLDAERGVELASATRAVGDAVLDALWRQWAALGAGAAAGGTAHAVVDPEALVMASLWFLDDESRLGDVLASWVVLNAGLLSMQRLRNVAALFPTDAQDRVKGVARLALERGKDFRWKPLVHHEVLALAERPGKTLSIAVPLERSAALMLRLRGLFGVGMRADVIAYMLSNHLDQVSAEDIATATVYNPTAVRRLLMQLSNAGGLQHIGSAIRPEYSIKGTPLARVAGSPASSLPKWRHTAQVFAAVTEYLAWHRTTKGRVVSPFALAVKADEIFSRHQLRYLPDDIIVPGRTATVGDAWTVYLLKLANWIGTTV